MWNNRFEERLKEWYALRQSCHDGDLERSLLAINDWWWQAPMVNHYLHWDDHRDWPGPWDLLADDMYCDLARGVGIMYTVIMLERPDISDIELAQCNDSNLVLVNQGKYILNWCPRQLLNIQSLENKPGKKISSEVVRHLLG
jgi:hypothetical protein